MLLEFLVTTLNMNSRYSLLFKLGLSENKFLMLGSQIGVIVRDKHNINYYKDIYIRISELIEDYCNSNSTLSKKIRTITILYKELNSSSFLELDLDNIELITENKEKINAVIFKKTSLSKDFSSKYLPLTINSKYYGNLLEGSLKIKYIDKLKSTISSLSGRSIPDYLLNLNLLTVYLRKQGKTGYYLIINKKINSEIENTIYNRYVFSLKTGICLYECTDTIKDTNLFIRKKKDTNLVIKNNKIIRLEKVIKFEELKYEKFLIKTTYKGMSNPNFGVLDVETYKDEKGVSHIYALGFVTLKEKKNKNIFYLTDYVSSLDSNLLLILCIDSMLISKYHNYNFYIHNMGKFDVIFIYKILKEFNFHKKEEYYILKSVFRDDVMLKLSISIKISNKKYIKINFIDSLNILNDKLKNLCKSFKIEFSKGIFPYNFVTKTNLNYIGCIPN